MKLSIILPSIRPQNLVRWFDAAEKSCKTYDYEVLIVSPYMPPEEILTKPNVTFIHSYCSPTVSFMQGSCLAKGEYIFNFTDDCLLTLNSLDFAIKIFDGTYGEKDILNLNYVEGFLDPDTLKITKEPVPFSNDYWLASTYPEYRKPGIDESWQLAPHFLMKRAYFEVLGGLDCNFEYLNYNLHDLVFRAQANGSKVYQSDLTCSLCSHLPDKTGDHGPINEAHYEWDVPMFDLVYSKPGAIASRIFLKLDSYKKFAKIWERRFNKDNLKIKCSTESNKKLLISPEEGHCKVSRNMKKPELSIIMPGIRPDNWDRAYESACKASKADFELIIISPYPLTKLLQGRSNVKYIKDFGSPTRATCMGSLLAEGKYIFPTMADDAVFIPDSIDKNLEILKLMGDEIKNVVVCKYSESQGFSHPERYQPDDYYKLVNAYPVDKQSCPEDWWIFNACFLHSKYFYQLGGYDASFEVAAMTHADLAMRAQMDGAIVKMSAFPILHCDHIPSGGDHTPIEIAQINFDTPKFKEKYGKPTIDRSLKTIELMNWKDSEAVWSRRFEEKK